MVSEFCEQRMPRTVAALRALESRYSRRQRDSRIAYGSAFGSTVAKPAFWRRAVSALPQGRKRIGTVLSNAGWSKPRDRGVISNVSKFLFHTRGRNPGTDRYTAGPNQ